MRCLLLACAVLAIGSPPWVSAAKPTLEVWTATPNPEGVSNCPPCNQFWRDFRSDQQFRARLTEAFQVQAVYLADHPVQGRLKMVSRLPTFLGPRNLRVVGYTSPADLIKRLGLRPIGRRPQGQESRPPAKPDRPSAERQGLTKPEIKQILQPYADRLNGLNSSLSKNKETIEVFGEWLREDRDNQERLQAGIDRLAEEIEAIEKQASQSPQKSSVAESPADPPSRQETDDSPGFFERLLEIGRAPAAWFLGPAGGAGLTALLWYYRSRKKKAEATAGLPEPIEGNSQLIERVLDRMNQLESKLIDRPAAVPVDSPPIREQSIEQRYVPYETDEFRKAVAFAHEQLVRKYPGAVGTVDFLDSLTDQYLQQLNSKEQPHVSQ